MKDFNFPFKKIYGKITNISDNGLITIKAISDEYIDIKRKKCTDVEILIQDGRKISQKQRSAIWSLIGEIAEWQGETKSKTMKDMINSAMKLGFLYSVGEDEKSNFSLSTTTTAIATAYQEYLIQFIVENEISTNLILNELTTDINRFTYISAINKKCVICGAKADLHHVERVGMGRNRNEIVHIGMECLPLCRLHHNEAHTMVDKEFFEKYHLDGGIKIDKEISKIYNLG